MAAQVHYIRTIHTSFTAAHPHTSTAWANAASRSLSSSTTASNPTITIGSINSHNQNMYQHHLQQYSSNHYTPQHKKYPQPLLGDSGSGSGSGSPITGAGAVAGGRRRSASIRHAPGTQIKFDPFADEPALGLGFGGTAGHPPPSQQRMYSHPAASLSSPCLAPPSSSAAGSTGFTHHHQVPYTIHIPPAAPTEIQRYSSPSARRFGYASSSRSGSGSGGSTRSSPSAQLPPIQNPNSTASSTTRMTGSLSGPNISKLVAGILLNRVHAVGKPMRRRAPQCQGARAYRKSSLSSVVCVEA